MHGIWGCEERLAQSWHGGRGSIWSGRVPRGVSSVWPLCMLSPFLSLSFFLFGISSFLFLILCMGRGDVRGVWHGVGVGEGAAFGQGASWGQQRVATLPALWLSCPSPSSCSAFQASFSSCYTWKWGCERHLAWSWHWGRGSIRAGCLVVSAVCDHFACSLPFCPPLSPSQHAKEPFPRTLH
ncbi:hypothetical protein PanWU01x14_145710 [Parasponia andersonii]|uniref:Transmembrane protein n=1 Tax=Parasponia andersonii TaxID=3476 RepID=A0A2P5CK83_PARAD|nr:hypothetical protein PanWU01x14_145710 [Parasponia andersonii]